MKVIFAIFVFFTLALSLANGASTNVDQRVDVIGNKANATENKEQCAADMDPESIKELLASIRKMMGKQRSCSTTDMGCRNMECCFIEGNEGGFVDDDNNAIVTENDEDLEENEDEASSRELVQTGKCRLKATYIYIFAALILVVLLCFLTCICCLCCCRARKSV